MAETLFHTVDHPSWHRRDRPKLGRQQYHEKPVRTKSPKSPNVWSNQTMHSKFRHRCYFS